MSYWRQMIVRKPVERILAEAESSERLHRILGPVALTSLGIGSVIGAGIFVTTGRVAALDAGPAMIVSYLIAAVGCALAALCYAEFASATPVSGSAYTYAYATLGELMAWIIGWDLILEYAMSSATVASAWTGYLNELLAALGWPQVPAQLSSHPFELVMVGGKPVQPWFNLPAVLIILAVTWVLVIGIRESARANTILVLVKLAVVLLVIGLGAYYIEPANWTSIPVDLRHQVPATTPAEVEAAVRSKWGLLGILGIHQVLVPLDDWVRSPFAPYGFSGVMLGSSIVFFAYIGFDAISTHAEEAARPQTDMPLAILAALAICTLLYMAVSAVITGMVPYPEIDVEAPLANAFSERAKTDQNPLLRVATVIIAGGGLAGMTSVLLVTYLSQARIFLAMARDGLLPPAFGRVHPRFRTPYLGTLWTGVIIALVAALTPITKLEEMVNIGTYLAFLVVAAAVLVLRVERPNMARPFRCPAVWFVAPAAIVVNLAMMLFLPADTWLRLVVWLVIGLVVYGLFGHRHSRLARETRPAA